MRFELFSLMSTLFVNTSLDSFFSVCVKFRDASASARVSITVGTAVELAELPSADNKTSGIADVGDVAADELVAGVAASLPTATVGAPSNGLLIVRRRELCPVVVVD